MRILKTKIEQSQKVKEEDTSDMQSVFPEPKEQIKEEYVSYSEFESQSTQTPRYFFHSSSPGKDSLPKKSQSESHQCYSGNNIMKNYCRGILNFALSRMAVTYLKPILAKYYMNLEDFRKFVNARKTKTNCIKKLREMLLIKPEDNHELAAVKSIFQEIAIIFLKYFVPNWIYNSKISDKYAHLRYRNKILRRVKNPHHFTYLQGFTYPC